jgi:proline iminopeptidase
MGLYTVSNGLAVYNFGDGEPVLLMPGPHRYQQPGDRTADALIEGLVLLGRQVITFDPPESGCSTRPSQLGMAEMHQCADEAIEVCAASQPVDAVGHSMGGLAVLAYTIEQVSRVKRLILIGTGSGGPAYMKAPGALWNRGHPAFWRMASIGLLYSLWPNLATEQMMRKIINRHSFYDPSHLVEERVRWRDLLAARQGRGSEWHRVARKLDYAPRLSAIDVPTLILCGGHDPQFPSACSEELATGIPSARLILFERSGHYPFIEEADAFWQAVGSFLGASPQLN